MIPKSDASSERGIALIVVLLLMVVLSGLATGFALTGQVESQMGQNEVYFAGARAAAEAGLNKSIVKIVADTSHNLLAGPDATIDSANPTAAANTDNGSLSYLLGGGGPYPVDAAGQYTYTVQVLDDDDTSLYQTALTSTQLTQMTEDGNKYSNTNDRLILKVMGYGPKGTVVTLERILETVDTVNLTTTTTTTLSNPAILVNGDFEMNGNITVAGSSGSVHANGNLYKTGASGTVSGSATATGTFSAAGGWTATGATGGGRPTVNVPDIHAANYLSYADYKLTSTGDVQTLQSGVWTNCTTSACKGIDWTYSSGNWSSGKNPSSATYYVEGNVTIGPTQGSSNKVVSVIATGNIDVNSNQAKLTPENSAKIQFVCDGDLTINASDLDDTTNIEGQILVRGQMDAGGNMEFQGRVMVQDVAGAGTLVANGATRIHGSVAFTYNGTLGAISTTSTTTTSGPTTYVNNIHGWIEQ